MCLFVYVLAVVACLNVGFNCGVRLETVAGV